MTGRNGEQIPIRTILAWVVGALTTIVIGIGIGTVLERRKEDAQYVRELREATATIQVLVERVNGMATREVERYLEAQRQRDRMSDRLDDLEAEFRRFVR